MAEAQLTKERNVCNVEDEAPDDESAPPVGVSVQVNAEETAEFADELKFLLRPECKPDLTDPKVRKTANMRKSEAEQLIGAEGLESRRVCGVWRNCVGGIVYSPFAQAIVLLVILFDVLCMILETADAVDAEDSVFDVADWLVVTVLSADVLARFFVEGWPFLKGKMNVFELILVPLTLAEVFVLKGAVPVPLLRALRPVFRMTRIIRILVKTAGKGKDYLSHLKHTVSGDRVRFQQDGFDLDLAYIGPQVIAMSVPGTGAESIFVNAHMDVARFMNERHGNQFLLLNVTEERKYPLAPFFDRYYHFPIAQDSVPALEDLHHLCEVIDSFLRADPDNVIAVHSRHAQGRCSLVIIALLIYRGAFNTVEAAIAYFEHNRAQVDGLGATTQTLDSASQHRFLEYFSHKCQVKGNEPHKGIRSAKLRRIQLLGAPFAQQVGVKCFGHPANTEETQKLRNAHSTDDLNGDEVEIQLVKVQEDVEIAMDAALQVPEDTMMEQLQRIVDEGSFDSPQAGCAPMTSRPLFDSTEGANEKILTKTLDPPSDTSQPNPPGVWEVTDQELFGEMRFEFHRQMPDLDGTLQKSTKSTGSVAHSKVGACRSYFMLMIQLLPCCCCFRRWKKKKPYKFEGGMVFAAWLHSGFLELDEPPTEKNKKSQNIVRVVLDRFSLDKACNAPPLRNQSTSLQLQLEFEVDFRVEWKELDEKQGQHPMVLASGTDVSEPETLHWLTFVSEKIWPSFEQGFKKLVEDLIAPLGDSMPAALKSRASVRLAQFSLGPEFPKFGPITACSRDHDGLEVQLDIMINYETFTNIIVDLGFASLGISYLRIAGILSVKFKPILPELPVFSAIQLLFLNPPLVEVKFAKTLEIANLAFVHDLIHAGIDKSLSDLMVLPNIIKINWADPDDDGTVSFQTLLPANVIRLGVIEAHGLKAGASMMQRQPDTLARVTVGSQEVVTRTIGKAANPVWSEEFDVLLYDTRQFVGGTVYDLDFAGRNRPIGTIKHVPVSQIVEQGEDGLWIDLVDTVAGASEAAILIRASMFELKVDPHHLHKCIGIADVDLSNGAPSHPSLPCISHLQTDEFTSPKSKADKDPAPEEEQVQSDGGILGCCTVATPEIKATEEHAGAVALLICTVAGGHIPKELTETHSMVDLKMHTDAAVRAGKSKAALRLAEVDAPLPVEPARARTSSIIERLADQGLRAADIAAAVDEPVADVEKAIRRRGWNFALAQKFCIFLHEGDLKGATSIDISLHLKKKTLAKGSMPIGNVLKHFHMCHSEVVKCPSLTGTTHVDVDAEFRIYSLVNMVGHTEKPKMGDSTTL